VELAQHVSPNDGEIERRSKPRIYDLFPATVHGVDSNGEVFETDVVLGNLSAAGLYIQIGHCIEPGATLAIIVELSPTPAKEKSTSRVVLYGMVLRAELKPNEACGVAMTLTHHRFL
jgi:hypothetical protein